MYVPQHFAVQDQQEIQRSLSGSLFGQLISHVDGELFATHLPFSYDRDRHVLFSHLARANPQWQSLENNQVLVVLPGPHGYVSPSWYRGPGVPTWNYQAVHAYGTARCFEEPERLHRLVIALTEKEEARFEQPWQPEFPASMLRGIVGVEIHIERLVAKNKLSQNKSLQDQKAVQQQLQQDNPALAKVMAVVNKHQD